MKLKDIFTPEELASIDSGTYDITRPILAAKLDLWAALEREACAKLMEQVQLSNAEDEETEKAVYGLFLKAAAAIRARGEK